MRESHLCEAGEEGGEGVIPSCGSRSPSQVPWEKEGAMEEGKANAGTYWSGSPIAGDLRREGSGVGVGARSQPSSP